MPEELVTIYPSLVVNGATYRCVRYTLHEALFEVSTLSCSIVQADDTAAQPKPSDLVGMQAVMTISRTDGPTRQFVGKVIEASRSNGRDSIDDVSLRIAPDLWRLGRRADCRIFQNLSVIDIATQVLVGAGIPKDRQTWKTKGTHPARTYVAQYRETDLEFVMRILSEEGIYFAIEFKDDVDHVVFGDDPAGFGPIPGTTSLPFRAEWGFYVVEDVVGHIEQNVVTRTDKVTLRDYNFLKPKLGLDSAAESTDPGKHVLEVYDYPGRFADKDTGGRLAKVALTAMQAERNVVSGETGTLGMQPGMTFSIEGHPYAPLDQKLLVTSVSIEGYDLAARFQEERGARDSGFGVRFTAIPASTSPYAPPVRERARVIPGIQTAFTTGPAGKEIYTNNQGQVKAQFHWDRLGKKDDKSSCWMRTSQLPTGGSVLLPRMKWEVTVRYSEGDADQPFVMARMYNATTPPPYALPAGKARSSVQTATTPGGGSTNEFRMDDTGGKEEMFFNASKDMSVKVLNNTTESVGNDQTRDVGADHSLSITNSFSANVGANQTVKVDGNQDVKVSTTMVDTVGGDQTLAISGNRDMKIGGDHKREIGGDSSLTVNANMIDLVVGAVTDHTLGNFTHDVGSAFVEMTAKNHALNVGKSMTETTGAVKMKGAMGDIGVQVGGTMSHNVAGAIINKVTGDRIEAAKANLTEIAAGAHIIKAKTVSYEAEATLNLVMGASIVSITPASITVVGASVKLDGTLDDAGALVSDN